MAEERKGGNLFLLLVGLAILAFAIGAVLTRAFSQSNRQSAGAVPPFDPTNVAELEIKGSQPDAALPWHSIEVPPAPPVTDALRERGRELYKKACAGCHGVLGKGDGPVPARYRLSTVPADLTQPLNSIKIRSTKEGTRPTAEDLYRTLTRGLPNTAMLSFATLPAEDRHALALHVTGLWSAPRPDEVSRPEPLPARIPSDGALIDAGKRVYQTACANCHGAEGTGSPIAAYDPDGRMYPGIAWAREGGARLLSGSSDEDLARTLLTGFHLKNPMRSFKRYFYESENPNPDQKTAGDRKLWGTVYYMRQLMDAQRPK